MMPRNSGTKNDERFEHRKEALIVILILVVVFGVLSLGDLKMLPFRSFEDFDVLAIVTSLFVVAVFVERSVEAILIPIRKTDRRKIEQKVKLAREEAKEDEKDENKKKMLLEEEKKLEDYKMETAKRAIWISFGFGLLISLVGVRTLAGLVDPSIIENDWGNMQRQLFSFVDVVLTGGVIAGGSAAIDKIGRKISENLGLSSATDSDTPNARSASQDR